VDYGLRFSERYTYDSRREGISIPAVLKSVKRESNYWRRSTRVPAIACLSMGTE